MSLIGQITNINQNTHIPSHIVSEHLASIKFADEVGKIQAKEKNDEEREIRKIEKTHNVDENLTEDEQKEYAKRELKHLDIKG